MIDLAALSAAVIAFAVVVYVVLDGYDLGVGILSAFTKDRRERDLMAQSIAPVWDGNEAWLVLAAGGLYAAFPAAYAVVSPALYVPLTLLVLSVALRAIAYQFRCRSSEANRDRWDIIFGVGSTIAVVSQGVALGAFIQGIEGSDHAQVSGWFDWLTPFSVMTGAALVCVYVMLGASWLILKSSGSLQDRSYLLALGSGFASIGFVDIVSSWIVLTDKEVFVRWFSWPNLVILLPITVIATTTSLLFLRAVFVRHHVQPFLLATALIVFGSIGVGVSLYPFIVPRTLTIWDAAARGETLAAFLVVAAIMVPITLAFRAYVFRMHRFPTANR